MKNIHSKHKNQNQRPCDRTNSSEEELFYCDFHKKSRLQVEFTVFSTNNQPYDKISTK